MTDTPGRNWHARPNIGYRVRVPNTDRTRVTGSLHLRRGATARPAFPRLILQGACALMLSASLAGCNSGSLPGKSPTMQKLEPVTGDLAAKAQGSCWFKVRSRSSRNEELRLWDATKAVGTKTERLGQLLIVTGGLELPVHEARFYGCSLFEYTAGSPVVMTSTASPVPVRADNLIPYGFSKDGKKELK